MIHLLFNEFDLMLSDFVFQWHVSWVQQMFDKNVFFLTVNKCNYPQKSKLHNFSSWAAIYFSFYIFLALTCKTLWVSGDIRWHRSCSCILNVIQRTVADIGHLCMKSIGVASLSYCISQWKCNQMFAETVLKIIMLWSFSLHIPF